MWATIALSLCLSLPHGCGLLKTFEDGSEAFEYRGIYLPGNSGEAGKAIGLHNLDAEWGIWGHNLFKILPKDHSHAIYAKVDGRVNTEQFCFSSDQLYHYVEEYISDNYGSNETKRFAILPNDNHVVCQCEQCIAAGCSYNDVAPAVFSFLERLANRFPNHIFFTSYYLTTRSLPTHALPENTGVLFSAIHYYLCARQTTREDEFKEQLAQWSRVTQHVYVWDYICNFDDYFSPYPTLEIMQRRFRIYKEAGVRGVFCNGSGYDYSTFCRLRSHVLAELMKNPDANWRKILHEKCRELYPVTGNIIEQFMGNQEDNLFASAKKLPIYEGVAVSRNTYLVEADIVALHDKLQRLLPQTKGEEQTDISKACKALCMTMLEFKRLRGDISGVRPLLHELQSITADGVRIYSESFWSVDTYVQEYTAMVEYAEANSKHNLLRGKQLTALTALDPDYKDLSILTDGLPALPHNYHCGHLISSADPWLRIAIPNVSGMKHLRVGMTRNLQFHIALPLRITLSAGGKEIATTQPQQKEGVDGRATVEFDIPANTEGTLILTIVRNKEEKTMALDEIEGW